MAKKIISTVKAPSPIGPYSQAVLAGNTLYVSGQIGFDPLTAELVSDSIESETEQVMQNLSAILYKADLSFDNVVKATIFVSNMDNFTRINEVYGTYFKSSIAPARETVEVSRLPKDVNVEISIIAVR